MSLSIAWMHTGAVAASTARRATVADLGREPFRIFFPQGVLAGIVGAALWPLHFSGLVESYPGQAHARLMVNGLFGAFIFGFLGTAFPRLLSAPPLGVRNLLLLQALHLGMVIAYAVQKNFLGDVFFLTLLGLFLVLLLRRAWRRKATPPPGFVLVGMAFACALFGAILAVAQPWMDERGASWLMLQRRFSYQAYVLLPILGIGPFLLPRFFGLPSPHDLAEDVGAFAVWKKKAVFALFVGLVIIGSIFLELNGSLRAGHALRFGAVAGYLLLEFPFRKAPKLSNALGACLRIAFGALVGGLLLITLFPTFRVGLLHLTLIGGFATIAFSVATRVLFGHSGHLAKLQGRNRWLLVAVGLMLFGMTTRISGDFWPKITATHYSYGAIIWIAGVLVWAYYALPRALEVEAVG